MSLDLKIIAAVAEKLSKKYKNVRIINHKTNMGYGAALKTGCDYALAHGAEKIVVLDADTQHEPSKIPDFLSKNSGSILL